MTVPDSDRHRQTIQPCPQATQNRPANTLTIKSIFISQIYNFFPYRQCKRATLIRQILNVVKNFVYFCDVKAAVPRHCEAKMELRSNSMALIARCI